MDYRDNTLLLPTKTISDDEIVEKFEQEILTHPAWPRQLELDNRMREWGIERYRRELERNREKQAETNTTSVRRLSDRAIDRMIEAIQDFIDKASKGTPGRKHSMVPYITRLDPDLIAYLTTQTILDRISQPQMLSATATAVGQRLEDEVNSMKYQEEAPGSFTRAMEASKTSSKTRHKWVILRNSAYKSNVQLEEWPNRDKVQIGLKLIDMFREVTGLITVENVRKGRHCVWQIEANEETIRWLEDEDERLEMLMPVRLPTVVPPKPWNKVAGGGYWSALPSSTRLIRTWRNSYLKDIEDRDMPVVYAAVNALQDTPWEINKPIFEVMEAAYAKSWDIDGMPPSDDIELPGLLPFHDKPKEAWTEAEVEEDREWRTKRRKIHEMNTLMRSRRLRFLSTIRVAREFLDDPEFYFPHSLDWRGRAYPMASYLHPQGSDIDRGLLQFANSTDICDWEAEEWLAIHGANMAGEDKVSFDERIQWVVDHQEQIFQSAIDPLSTDWWTTADKPFCFLAFCMEWKALKDWERKNGGLQDSEGNYFQSKLPVQMDGTCNGLQNFSAMLRDDVGGKAVNLLPSDQPQDIYMEVAEVVFERLKKDVASGDKPYAEGWFQLMKTPSKRRKVVKRPVMTLAYGSRRYGFVDSVMDDTVKSWRIEPIEVPYPFLHKDEATGLPKDYGTQAAEYMGGMIWDCVGEVVVAAKNAMDWLQDAARIASKSGKPIKWTTPAGLMVEQAYTKDERKLIKATFGGKKIQLRMKDSEGTKYDKRKQASGISPNLVHSLDASHLMFTIVTSKAKGIQSFSMVHDSYGTHASNAGVLAHTLRDCFVDMYQRSCVLEGFREELQSQLPPDADEIPPTPEKGNLDLEQVRKSPFFFA